MLQSPADRLSESRAALERKAQLYERLTSGHIDDDEAEKYEVDFLMKGFSGREGGPRPALDTAEAAVQSRTGGLISADMAMERDRRAWEDGVHASMHDESAAEQRGEARRELIRQIEVETMEGRRKAATAREEREAAEARKREWLKAAFLERKIRAAKQQKGTGTGAGTPGGLEPG